MVDKVADPDTPALMDEEWGWEFWWPLFMMTLCLVLAGAGLIKGWGYMASVGGLLAVLHTARLVARVRRVRFARRLNKHPELLTIYRVRGE